MSNNLTNDKISSPEVVTETNGEKGLNNTVVNTNNGSNAKSDDKKSIESDGNTVTTSDDKINNNKERDDKGRDERKIQLLKESKKKKKYLQMIINESKRLTEIIVPISVCMLLVILSIHFFPVFITGFHDLYDEHIGQGKNSSAGDILTSALIMGLVFVVLMACVTFVMAIVIIYEFTRCMKAFFILAFVIYFGLFGAGYLFIAVSEYNVAMDWISILLILWNYTGVGIIVFFIAGPKLLKQIYLILLTANVALILMLVLPKWTTWVLLFLMCGWDLYAVLHKTGPLNRMMASMDTNEKEMPPLLYSTAIWVLMSDKSKKRDTDHDSGVQLGLGDFVFYSLLVGTSFASGDLLTAIMCCISILVGLAITLFILLIRNTPLPALPISITLGVLTNFCAQYCVIPFNDALQDRLIFI